MATTRIYLDTNQWTNCVEPRVAGWTTRGLEDLRAAMRAKLDAGEDRAFRDTLAQVPRNPVKVITFNDFAAMMGVRPH